MEKTRGGYPPTSGYYYSTFTYFNYFTLPTTSAPLDKSMGYEDSGEGGEDGEDGEEVEEVEEAQVGDEGGENLPPPLTPATSAVSHLSGPIRLGSRCVPGVILDRPGAVLT